MDRVIDIGDDVNEFMKENYRRLHETQGTGLGDSRIAWGLTFYFIRKDGSLYKDTIPVLVEKAVMLQRLAPHLQGIMLSNFELNNKEGSSTYVIGTELIYRH